MDLVLLENSSTNTVFTRPDNGAPLYHVDTPFKFFSQRRTTILKVQGPKSVEMGFVELHSWSEDIVNVWGKDLTPRKDGLFSPKTFVAADGREYRWKDSWGEFRLVPTANTEISVAFFDSGSLGFFSKARPAMLCVTPEGMPILDDIVATFIYARQARERRQRRNRSHASGGGGGGGGC